jgi:hypothetical protein
MTVVRTKHQKNRITRLVLVLALAAVAAATLTGLTDTLRGDDHGQEQHGVPPEVATHMHMWLGGRSVGDLFPQQR